jgi:protein O-GlcNAc transferase
MSMSSSLNEALSHHRAGRLEEAARRYRALLVQHAQEADLHHLLALALSAAAPAESRASLRRAMMIAPSTGLYAHNAARLDMGAEADMDEPALARRLSRALALDPAPSEAHHRLGLFRARAQLWAQAARSFRHALALDPALPPALHDLAKLAITTDRRPEAIRRFRRFLQTRPDDAAAWRMLGSLASEAGDPSGAIAGLKRALVLGPASSESWRDLVTLLFTQGRVQAAFAARMRSLALDPGNTQAHYEFVSMLPVVSGLSEEAQLAQRREVHRRFSDPLTRAAPPHRNTRDPDRRLRIGYVDDRMLWNSTHAVFLLPLVEAQESRPTELFFYTNLPEEEADSVTRRYAAVATVRHVAGLDDEALAGRVRDDAIDILIDVIGHLTGARAGLFARKPAPLQVTMLQVASSGMAAMDYAVADHMLLPPGRPEHFSEKILRLPVGFLFKPVDAPGSFRPIRPAGAPVTFGSFNQLAKIDEAVLALWARVLACVPGSRLLLKAAGLVDPAARQRIADILRAQGIDPARLDLRPWTRDHAGHLAAYGEVDVMLDCFPYPGITTSMEALLMGVPLVTLAGDRFVTRYGAAILTATGHPEWIAPDQDRYIAIAAGLASDPALRAHLRESLRQDLLASPLCDPRSFTAALEDAFRAIWRNWCRG